MALLQLRPGRADPYRIYDRIPRPRAAQPDPDGQLGKRQPPGVRLGLRNRRLGAGPLERGEADEFNLSFLEMNPPDHTRLRRLALPAFSPKAVASYRDRIERTVGGLLDAASAAGEFDLMTSFAAPLPIAVITDLLGIPDADAREFSSYGAVIASALDGIRSLRHARQLQANDAKLQAAVREPLRAAAPRAARRHRQPPGRRGQTRSARPRWCRCASCCWSRGSRPRST